MKEDLLFHTWVTQTVTQAIGIEVKLVSALVIALPVRKVQAQVVYPSTLRCFLFHTFLLWVGEQSDLYHPRSINTNFKDFYFLSFFF